MKNAFLCVFSDPKKLNRTCGVSLLKHGMNETIGLHGKENPIRVIRQCLQAFALKFPFRTSVNFRVLRA